MNEIVVKIEGLAELTKVVRELAALHGRQENVGQEIASVSQPMQATQPAAPTLPPATQPAIPPTTPQVTVPTAQGTPPAAPLPAQVPTTAVPQQYSFDQLAVAMSNLCANTGKQPEVHALLNRFGVNALFDLPKELYGEFATALRGIGGVI